jgi:eukaryotic-like serine/threonine-protein kinase
MSQNPTPGNPSNPKELTGRIGKYDIIKPLGKGAMGVVYLAHDTVLERDVALKVMVAQIADDPELNQRFIREAKAVARMTHPNVVNVFDLGSHTDGSPYIAMELLKGQDLQKAVRSGPPMSLERKLAIIVQVLAGLAHAHEAGIVHRDIKPANIFINADGTVKIMDFGVARLTTASMTGTGNIVGTADYMSPEQVKGARVDGRSDLFSVGCMLFELLTGQRPFHSDNLMAIFYKITHEEPNFSTIPVGKEYEALMPVLQKALAKILDDRYQTAYEFATDLRDYLKVHATSRSGQHALEELLDIAPPKSRPEPLTDAPGATVVQAGTNEVGASTMDIGPTKIDRGAPRGGTGTLKAGAPTAAGGRTTGSSPTVLAPGARAPRPYPGSARRGEEPGSKTGLFVGIGLAVVALGIGGYFVLKPKPDENRVVQTTPAPTPAPSAAATAAPTSAPATVATAAATVAPTPALRDTGGKAAAFLKEAQAALGRGDYERAMKQAQAALGEDPGNSSAQDLVTRALNGQKAATHFQAAESALRSSHFAEAQREAESGRSLAPWDSRGTDLLSRVHEAQRRQQQQAEKDKQAAENKKAAEASTRVADMLGRAAVELASSRYDGAIALYQEVLKLDPGNRNALDGLTAAAAGKGASNTRPTSAKRFVVGETKAQSAETKASGGPDGFDVPAGMEVKRGSQATDLPGKIGFEVSPDAPAASSSYAVKILFRNEGSAPIQIQTLLLTTTINGKRIGPFPVSAQVKDVAPHERVVIFNVQDFWKEDTKSWAMEAKVTTSRRETYTNTVVWQ